ncbi:hypothetical protein KM043_005437 [Ampulex compressa]|nr:hypothetical protein KM043_005437 [Ampulex compressa]
MTTRSPRLPAKLAPLAGISEGLASSLTYRRNPAAACRLSAVVDFISLEVGLAKIDSQSNDGIRMES